VAAFIGRHADAQRLAIDGAPSVQLLPHADHDGFFYALLQKN
jgi:16S rRNA (cytosine967-C5)-methyltransferase